MYMQQPFGRVERIVQQCLSLGKNLLQEDHPDRQIHIFNSKSASVGQTLIAMKIQECEEAGFPFDKVIETVEEYIEQQHTFFVLDNLEHFVKTEKTQQGKALVNYTQDQTGHGIYQKKVQSVSPVRQEGMGQSTG